MRKFFLAMVCVLLLSGPAHGETIRVVTEEWPPYNCSSNGEIRGVVTEIVRASLDRAGVDYTIEILPWARAYELAQTDKDVLIYSIFKLPSRETLFKWIQLDGLSIDMYLFRPKFRKEIELTSLDDAKKYKIGVTRETSTHHFLLSKGFEEGKNLFPVNQEQFNALKSRPQTQRIDMTTGDHLSLAHWLKEAKLPSDYWERQILLFKKDFYMAFSLKTPDSLVDKVRKAFHEIRDEGELQAIVDKYHRMFE